MLFKSQAFQPLWAHASRHALLTLAVCVMIPSVASAQTPVFVPAAGWEVNAGQLSQVRGLKTMKLPCVISTEYDNGYVVRFSGGGSKLLALAIDFRQDVFMQGRQYDSMISIGGNYVQQVKATAFTKSTLIFNLRPLAGFYDAAQNGNDMEIQIEGNTLKFALGRLGAAYGQLESCYAGKGDVAPVKPITTQTASKAPVEGVQSEPLAQRPMPSSLNDIVRNADAENAETTIKPKLSAAQPRPPRLSGERSSAPDMMPMPDSVTAQLPDSVTAQPNTVSRAMPTETASAAPMMQPTSATWEAEAGEDMKSVLMRWSQRAGYDLQWQSDQGGQVAQNIAVTGSFEEAVGQLLAENSAATGIGAHVETTTGATKAIAGSSVPSSPMSITPDAAQSNAVTRDEWVAAPGSNIQTVLNQWSSQAGVAIVWQSYMDFAVKQPVRMSGSYEDAVAALLDQFMNDSVRPVAELNTDPESGARTLLMDKSS